MKKRLIALAIAAVVFTASNPAPALLDVRIPTDRIYNSCKSVVRGEVVEVDAKTSIATVKLVEALRGEMPKQGDKGNLQPVEAVRLVYKPSSELFKAVEKGAPAIFFYGVGGTAKGATVIAHVSDAWVTCIVQGPTGYAAATTKDEFDKSFPGTTKSLLRIIDDLKADKYSLINKGAFRIFSGDSPATISTGLKNPRVGLFALVQKTPVYFLGDGNAVHAFGVNGNTATEQTRKWFQSDRAPYSEVTTTGELAGKKAWLVNERIFVDDGTGLLQAPLPKPSAKDVVAAAFFDADKDGANDILTLTKTGLLLAHHNPGKGEDAFMRQWETKPTQLWPENSPPALGAVVGDFGEFGGAAAVVLREDGLTRYELTANGVVTSDFHRLAGDKTDNFFKTDKPFANAKIISLDATGDGRADLFISGPNGSVFLINRGYGCFFADSDPGKSLAQNPAFKSLAIDASTVCFGADIDGDKCDDLVVVDPSGDIHIAPSLPGK